MGGKYAPQKRYTSGTESSNNFKSGFNFKGELHSKVTINRVKTNCSYISVFRLTHLIKENSHSVKNLVLIGRSFRGKRKMFGLIFWGK